MSYFYNHFRLNVIEKELPRFEETPNVIMNGLESPCSSPMSERSRSPSPTHIQEMPSYSVSEVNFVTRPSTNHYNYTSPSTVDTLTTNSLNDFYSSISPTDDKQISQILKEANMNLNNGSITNTFPETKPKVSIVC